MNNRDQMSAADRDRLLEIWQSRVRQGENYKNKNQLEADVRSDLLALALELHAQNWFWPSEAIAGFLLDETNSLDSAFEIKRGKPMSTKTLERDAVVLWLRLTKGCSFREISKRTNMERKDVGGLCNNKEGYERRFTAAIAHILANGGTRFEEQTMGGQKE